MTMETLALGNMRVIDLTGLGACMRAARGIGLARPSAAAGVTR